MDNGRRKELREQWKGEKWRDSGYVLGAVVNLSDINSEGYNNEVF